jgi:hypothetical protein
MLGRALQSNDATFAALGLLSAAGAAEKSTAAQYRARRTKLREDARRFAAFNTGSVAMRFVLAGGRTAKNALALDEARQEAGEHGDMVLLNASEGRFTCSRKYLLWLRAALAMFPSVLYIGLGDDDIYIQLDHFVDDLRSIRKESGATRHIFWGLIMWKAYYNNATMVTSTGFTGWGFTDWAAVAQRTQMEACRSPSINTSLACPGLREDHVEAAQLGHIGSPPFPMANGPLSTLSRSLAEAIAYDSYPPQWLDALQKTPRIMAALARPGGPRKSSFACWPVVDSILGYWVTRIGLTLNESVTLVNTPLMKQHHPWPSAVRGRFSNSSIILHGLKKPQHERFRELAIARGSGPFVPYTRECGTCESMGWSTWPSSPMGRWQCCGSKVEPRQLKRACRGRMCPKTAPKRSQTDRAESPAAGTRSHRAARSHGEAMASVRSNPNRNNGDDGQNIAAVRVDSRIAFLERELASLRAKRRDLVSGERGSMDLRQS